MNFGVNERDFRRNIGDIYFCDVAIFCGVHRITNNEFVACNFNSWA